MHILWMPQLSHFWQQFDLQKGHSMMVKVTFLVSHEQHWSLWPLCICCLRLQLIFVLCFFWHSYSANCLVCSAFHLLSVNFKDNWDTTTSWPFFVQKERETTFTGMPSKNLSKTLTRFSFNIIFGFWQKFTIWSP